LFYVVYNVDRLLVVDRCIGVYEGNSGTLSQYFVLFLGCTFIYSLASTCVHMVTGN